GELKYTHTGTFWAYRAPGDRDFGANVACATDGTYRLYSDNPSKWVDVTLDVGDASADGRSAIEFASTTNEPDGLEKMCDLVRAPTLADGDDFSFDILDSLLDQV